MDGGTAERDRDGTAPADRPGFVHESTPLASEGNHADAGELEAVIAERAREYRIAAGLTVSEMAQRVGISKAMLSKIENAQTSCSLTTLARLAQGLEVPVTAL